MAKGVLHIEKHKMNEVRIIERNIKKDQGVWSYKGKGINYKNYIDARIKQLDLQKKVRKDAVAMVSVLVTTEKNFFENLKISHGPDKIRIFFSECYEILAARYGGNDGMNIISCTVYKGDNWKMYFCFVPATSDNRLCARSVLNPHGIRYLHRDFDKLIWTPWGVNELELQKEKVDLENEKILFEKEMVILEKKNNQIRNENSQLKLEKIRISTEIQKGTNAVQNLRNNFKKLKNELNEAESQLNNIKNSLTQDQIQEKILKDDIAHLEREKEALKRTIKDLRINLGLIHGLEPDIRKNKNQN